MSYRIAIDNDPDNPNPHALDVGAEGYATEGEAEAAADDELQEQRDEGYDDDQLMRYVIVNVPDPPVLNGVYVVQVGPDISDDPVRWCFVNESDADDFKAAIGDEAWVTFEPIASSLDDPLFVESFPDEAREAQEIARAKV